MFKVLTNTDNFDLTNKVLVERTIKDLWALQECHELELEEAWACESMNEAILLRGKIKQKIKNTNHDLDILCKYLWGDLES